MSRFFIAFFLTATMLTFVSGCSKTVTPDGMPSLTPCELILSQEGKPLHEAAVTLIPVDTSSKWSASGSSDAAGKARIMTWGAHVGVVPGKYKVLVSKIETEKLNLAPRPSDSPEPSEEPKSYNLVEERFGNAETTKLEIEVVKGQKDYPLDIGKAVRILVP